MPDATEVTNDTNDTGVPMPEPMQPTIDSPNHGAAMPDDDEDDDTLPGFPPADFARAELSVVARSLGHDEVRVLTRIADRLRGGQAAYGPLDLAHDTRQFRAKEAREEIEDALVYLACAWLKTQTQEVTR